MRRGSLVTVVVLLTLIADAEGAPRDAVRERIRARLESATSLSVAGQALRTGRALGVAYRERVFEPVWIDGGCPARQSADLLDAVQAASRHGLRPDDYHAALFSKLLKEAQAACKRGHWDVGAAADFELLATDTYFLLASHAAVGKLDPATMEPDWQGTRRTIDPNESLNRALRGGIRHELGHRVAPSAPEYWHLVAALARYRDIEAKGGWPLLQDGPELAPEATGERVSILRRRLAAEGYAVSAEGQAFDEGLAAKVRDFQQRHGLSATGRVDSRTLEALREPVESRIAQIEANMERWRWLPDDLGTRHIRVNVPTFELVVREAGRDILSMRAIVGRQYRRTPVLSSEVAYAVLNPSWTVPRTIATQDLLPKLRGDPSYLKKNGFKLYRGWGADAAEINPSSVRWGQVRNGAFPYRLVQAPGPANALGRIKFMFPNRFGVYLHDTPKRELFEQEERDLSSGCIRLERPLDLAVLLFRDSGWSREQIERALADGKERTVRASMKMPVHLLYMTAWSEDGGPVHFRRDLYGRDERLRRALREPPPATAAGSGRGGAKPSR